jgi:hypothetical protein
MIRDIPWTQQRYLRYADFPMTQFNQAMHEDFLSLILLLVRMFDVLSYQKIPLGDLKFV